MRLFGVVGGTLDQARATYGFIPPFDLALALPTGRDFAFGNGGVIFDLGGTFQQYGMVMLAFPDYVFVSPAAVFNPALPDTPIQGECIESDQEIIARPPNYGDSCVC